MEGSVTFYLLDLEDGWDNLDEHRREQVAVFTLQEWICSDYFKAKASHYEIDLQTTVGKQYLESCGEHLYWLDDRYLKLDKLRQGIYEYWQQRKWACLEKTRNGRPRRAEYSHAAISNSMKHIHASFQIVGGGYDLAPTTLAKMRSILGENNTQCWIKLIVIKENIFKHVYSKTGAEYLTGCTKDEIADKLNLPKKFVDEMCRWLVDNGGWKVVQAKRDGARRREMRRSVVN